MEDDTERIVLLMITHFSINIYMKLTLQTVESAASQSNWTHFILSISFSLRCESKIRVDN